MRGNSNRNKKHRRLVTYNRAIRLDMLTIRLFRFGTSDGVARTPSNTPTTSGSAPRGSGPGGRATISGSAGRARRLSDNFVPLLRQQLRLGLGHKDAIEVYYNAAITPWFNAALDLQIIDQALEEAAQGLRVSDQGREHCRVCSGCASTHASDRRTMAGCLVNTIFLPRGALGEHERELRQDTDASIYPYMGSSRSASRKLIAFGFSNLLDVICENCDLIYRLQEV